MNNLPTPSAAELSATAHQLRNQGKIDAAVALAERALAAAPNDALIVGQVGNLFATCRPGPDATEVCLRGAELNPEPIFASGCYHNAALSELATGDPTRAAGLLTRAVSLNQEHLGARWDLSLANLMCGDWADGFRDAEIRFKREPWTKGLVRTPRWPLGKKINGQILWVHAEQGVGDILQFARYLPWAAAQCRKLIFSAPPCLLDLFKGYPGVHELLSWSGEPLAPEPHADWSCALMSLPLHRGDTPDNVQRDSGFWTAMQFDPYLQIPLPVDDQLKVGLCWAGNPSHPLDRHRSIPLELLAPLIGETGVQFYSLQVGPRREDLLSTGLGTVVFDLGQHLHTWGATLQALRQLDLVITVDTAVAHLAALAEVKTCLLLSRHSDWRWLAYREDTPWYPEMKLFRQHTLGDWSTPLACLRVELTASVAAWNPRTHDWMVLPKNE